MFQKELPDGVLDLIVMLCANYEEMTDIVRKADIDLYCKLPLFQGTRNTINMAQLAKLPSDSNKAATALNDIRMDNWDAIKSAYAKLEEPNHGK